MDSNNRIKLSDFGLSRDTNSQSFYLTSSVAGTMRYLAPEQINKRIQSVKNDIWAFGVVILELACGRDSFEDTEIFSIKKQDLFKKLKD